MERNRLLDRAACNNSPAYNGIAAGNNHAAGTTHKGGYRSDGLIRPNSNNFCDPAFSYNLTQPETLVRFAVVELLSNWQALAPSVTAGGK